MNLKTTTKGRKPILSNILFKKSYSALSSESMFAKYNIMRISESTVKFDKTTDKIILSFFFVTPVN